MNSHSTVHIGTEGTGDLYCDLSNDRIGVRFHTSDSLDVWVDGTPAELNKWVSEVVQAVYRATSCAKRTKIASSPSRATDGNPEPVPPPAPGSSTKRFRFDAGTMTAAQWNGKQQL